MTDPTTDPPVLLEEKRWTGIVAQVLAPDADLVSVSRWIPDSRAYGYGDRVAIIRMIGGQGRSRLEHAAATSAVLSAETEYIRGDNWEALVMPLVDGVTLESLIPHTSWRTRVGLLLKTVTELHQMHERGIAHCDLRPDNVIVTPKGDVRLVDFDRAIRTGRFRAAVADWSGLGAPGPAAKPYWKLILLTLTPRTRSLMLRARALMGVQEARPMPEDVQLRLLEEAWSLAQSSGANAPGQRVAYYAFTFKGWHLPGERAWYQRWEPIRRRVDFTSKRVLELGCNLGLLSSFAALHGASEAIGVDHSQHVVQAARLVARALSARAEFECLDLVSDRHWDRRLRGADVVVAMSVVHWLPSADRVLRFLGEHEEVIYEGHDPLDVEAARLRQLGFRNVEVICRTERGREVLYAHH